VLVPFLSGRVVVVSPHLDDAVFSLGATIANSVQHGARVEVLTVYGSEPTSDAPAGPWDINSGFKTEGESATSRREEDKRACRVLGAEPRWLNYGSEPYERHGSDAEIWSAVDSATRGADWVLIPGFPLAHPDHAELSKLLLSKGLGGSVGLYVEQPYLFYERRQTRAPSVATVLQPTIGSSLTWTRFPMDKGLRRTKMEACRQYTSQLRQLGMGFRGFQLGLWGLRRMLAHEAAQGGEAIAWLPAAAKAQQPYSPRETSSSAAAP
jgi:LmbE family N-acetylglucosaminyl deacetylase